MDQRKPVCSIFQAVLCTKSAKNGFKMCEIEANHFWSHIVGNCLLVLGFWGLGQNYSVATVSVETLQYFSGADVAVQKI